MSDGGKGDKRRPGDDKAFDEGYSKIFGNSKPKRGRYLWDATTQEFVPFEEFVRPQAGPYVIGDIQPHQSMVTGEMVQSRSRHREILREHNLIEVGNETKALLARNQRQLPSAREDLIRIVNQKL